MQPLSRGTMPPGIVLLYCLRFWTKDWITIRRPPRFLSSSMILERNELMVHKKLWFFVKDWLALEELGAVGIGVSVADACKKQQGVAVTFLLFSMSFPKTFGWALQETDGPLLWSCQAVYDFLVLVISFSDSGPWKQTSHYHPPPAISHESFLTGEHCGPSNFVFMVLTIRG